MWFLVVPGQQAQSANYAIVLIVQVDGTRNRQTDLPAFLADLDDSFGFERDITKVTVIATATAMAIKRKPFLFVEL